LLLCTERGRHSIEGTYPEDNTDATAIGTAVHAGIEHRLRSGASADICVGVALDEFAVISATPGFRWVKVKKAQTACRYIEVAVRSWFSDVLPKLGSPVWVEQDFNFVADERDGLQVRLSGTIDYLDSAHGLMDWKTAGDVRKYQGGYGGEGWKLKRWGVQPTVYTLAQHTLLGHTPPLPFTFVANTKGTDEWTWLGEEQGLVRDETHWSWLIEQMWSYVGLIRSGLAVWPKNDQHALCSPDWCQAWNDCKGKHENITTIRRAA
jgi:hypothetical protein